MSGDHFRSDWTEPIKETTSSSTLFDDFFLFFSQSNDRSEFKGFEHRTLQ